MKKYALKIETSGLKGTITVPFHAEQAANESLRALQAYMEKGGGLYGLPGITTLDTTQVTGLSVTSYDDGEGEQA